MSDAGIVTLVLVVLSIGVLIAMGLTGIDGMSPLDVSFAISLVVLSVVLIAKGVQSNREIQAALPDAPARVRAYLEQLGTHADGDMLCRVDSGIFFDFGLLCDASVRGKPTVIRCGFETCWVEK